MAVPFKTGREVTVRDARLGILSMYELAELRGQIEQAAAEQDGELTQEQEALWDAIPEAFETKVEGTALLIREREAQADMVRQEARRLTEWATSLDADAERLRALLLSRMTLFGKSEVSRRVKVSIASNPPSVREKAPLDEATLRELAQAAPYAVRIVPESLSLNKAAIKDQAKVTGALPDALAMYVEIVQTKGLRIK